MQALKVLDEAMDYNGQKVPAKTILLNVHKVSQRVGLQKKCGIEGVNDSGAVLKFLESENPLHFSTRLIDVKCGPKCFTVANMLQFPQTARVYLHLNTEEEEEEEEANLLQNRTTVTIAEPTHDHHLVVRKLCDGRNQLGSVFTVPFNADMKVM